MKNCLIKGIAGLTTILCANVAVADSASEQLEMIGKCIAINNLYEQRVGPLPAANKAYMQKWAKARQGAIDGHKQIEPCLKSGKSFDSCVSQLGSGLQVLLRGGLLGTDAFLQEYKVNNKAKITTYLLACSE
ncbi:hypothetical protein G3I67_13105 [Orrella sp. NBD-18]|uniref:Lysozyme inhibitor LprI N-terminal domain-containing protein n=1 Tax=Sheuella amnicola TaxID=2707330 RepID=A0A6B2R541_9BURK|nr:hypothetical protein [Sheuella amnicola]NDY84167.1 hypothetical protein [Sheuella amnicola]